MIEKMKMRTAGKTFGKISLTAIRDTYCPICGLQSRKGRGETGRQGGGSNFLMGVKSILGMKGETSVSPLMGNLDPHIRNTLGSLLGLFTVNDFEKSQRQYSRPKEVIYSM